MLSAAVRFLAGPLVELLVAVAVAGRWVEELLEVDLVMVLVWLTSKEAVDNLASA